MTNSLIILSKPFLNEYTHQSYGTILKSDDIPKTKNYLEGHILKLKNHIVFGKPNIFTAINNKLKQEEITAMSILKMLKNNDIDIMDIMMKYVCEAFDLSTVQKRNDKSKEHDYSESDSEDFMIGDSDDLSDK